MESLVFSMYCRQSSVQFRYSCSVYTRDSVESSKVEVIDLSGLAVLVRAANLKEAPSVERHRKRTSRAHNSEALSAFARAMSITSICVTSINKEAVSSRNCRTLETSHHPE